MKDILGERDENIPDVPTRVAQPSRESQLPKRFYAVVSTEPCDGGFVILLDGKPIKTPGRAPLQVGNEAVASLLVDEWEAQIDRIDPMMMPVTRIVNTSIDGVAIDPQAVKEDIIRYAGTDLLCYRVSEPQGLVDLQIENWDPLLDWSQSALGARFDLAEGIMYIAQSPETIASISVHVGAIDDPLVLAATHVVMSLTGSAVIALAVLKGRLDVDEAWRIAHLDEEWNAKHWGRDEDADELRAKRLLEMNAACKIIHETG